MRGMPFCTAGFSVAVDMVFSFLKAFNGLGYCFGNGVNEKSPSALAEGLLYSFSYSVLSYLSKDYLYTYNAPCPPVAIQQQQQHIMLFIARVIFAVLIISVANLWYKNPIVNL